MDVLLASWIVTELAKECDDCDCAWSVGVVWSWRAEVSVVQHEVLRIITLLLAWTSRKLAIYFVARTSFSFSAWTGPLLRMPCMSLAFRLCYTLVPCIWAYPPRLREWRSAGLCGLGMRATVAFLKALSWRYKTPKQCVLTYKVWEKMTYKVSRNVINFLKCWY